MDISGRTVWQKASGDTDRDYSDLCLKWDVILNGPGLQRHQRGPVGNVSGMGKSIRLLERH